MSGRGVGALSTNQKVDPSGAPFALTSADNGVSVDPVSGRVVLGNNAGAVGDPAQLLNSREIETNAFDIVLVNAGFSARLGAAAIFVNDPTGNLAAGIFPGLLSVSDNSAANNAVISFANNIAPTGDLRLQGDVFQFERQGFPAIFRILLISENVLIGPNLVDNGQRLQVEGLISMDSATANLNFPNTAAQTSSDLTIALAAAAVGDMVALGYDPAGLDANSCYTAFVDSAGSITVRFNNYSAAAIDPAARDFTVSVLKRL